MDEPLHAKYTRIFLVICCYWFISISLVFVNKHLLNSDALQLNAPLFVTWFQCIVTVAACLILRIFATHFPKKASFPPVYVDISKAKNLLPLSFVFVGMITFNNLCLQYVGVAFYNVGRSLTTVFNLVLSFAILGQKTSSLAILTCGVIVFGFLLGVDQESESPGTESEFSYLGVIYGILASLCVSLYAILTKKLLPVVDNQIWLLTYYNNINASLLFIPMMYFNAEVGTLIAFQYIGFVSFWAMMIFAGLLGISIAYVSSLQIQVTSPLTHNISGTAKACVQTVLAVSFNNTYKSFLWWFSNLLVLTGSLAYAKVRQDEMKTAHHTKDSTDMKA